MKEYKRAYPLFSLCGLTCGLCPRYNTDGKSKCPGCGGPEFHLKHPSCAVITCNKKQNNVEYCSQCPKYPCKKYFKVSDTDSFISYKNVLSDFKLMNEIGEDKFKEIINSKMKILEELLTKYNDGKKKNFYCLAVNLLTINDLNAIMLKVRNIPFDDDNDLKEQIKQVVSIFKSRSRDKGIELKLRK